LSIRTLVQKQDCAVILQELALPGSHTLMLITDVQVHLWEIDRPDRPRMKGLQRPPHRPDGFGAEEILAEMDAVGVERAVIVPPTWVGDNNQSVLEALPSLQADLRSLAASIQKHRMLVSS
jgi:predicted TIM-barrel fold metal-dependent hydrolase